MKDKFWPIWSISLKNVYKIWNYVETSEYCISADKQSSEVSPWPSIAPCTHVCGPLVCPITPAGYHRHPRYFYCNPETFRAIQMFRALPLLLKSIFKSKIDDKCWVQTCRNFLSSSDSKLSPALFLPAM